MTFGNRCDKKFIMMNKSNQIKLIKKEVEKAQSPFLFIGNFVMLKPIKDRIVIRPDVLQNHSPILALDDDVCHNSGTVLSVGEDVVSVMPGNHVVFHQFDELELKEYGVVVIREKSLLCIDDA